MPEQRPGALPACTWSGEVWRYTPKDRQPLDAAGSVVHGGRWNPPGAFAALYLGTPRTTVLDDLAAAHRALGLTAPDLRTFALHQIRASVLRLLDLRYDEGREELGLRTTDMSADDRGPCQRVGQIAWEADLHGVLAPAATGSGLVLAVFPDRAPPGALAVHRSEALR